MRIQSSSLLTLLLLAIGLPSATAQDDAGDASCAGLNERSQQCGADNPTRPAKCCEGYVCMDGAGVKCVVDPDAATINEAGGGGGGGEGDAQESQQTTSAATGSTIAVAGEITVQGTSFESTTQSNIVRITVPVNTPPKSFVIMFMGDSAGDASVPERAAYHDNWIHLADVGQNEGYFIPPEPEEPKEAAEDEEGSERVNLKVQHKFWSGNLPDFKVWDDPDTATTLNKFVMMPNMVGVDADDPIVDFAATRFDGVQDVVAPSVYGVNGGAVVIVYLFDDAEALATSVTADDFTVLNAAVSRSGEAMSAFVARTSGGCTGTIGTAGTGEPRSGIVASVSLRPVGNTDDKDTCDQDESAPAVATADEVGDIVFETPSPTAAPVEAEVVVEETSEPTSIATETIEEPTTGPTAEPTVFTSDTEMPTVAEDSSVADTINCAPEGEKAVDCGAGDRDGRSQSCCDGLVCGGNKRCRIEADLEAIAANDGQTSSGTSAVVAFPLILLSLVASFAL